MRHLAQTKKIIKTKNYMKTKVLAWTSVIIVAILFIAGYFKFYFVYSEGVNEGDINYFQKEGFVFKTYEGKMIQTGYNSKNANTTIQSNEFKFSVDQDRIAKQIEESSSRQIKLHWKRYLGTLPWRGKSEYVVDSIMSSSKPQGNDYDNLLEVPVY